MTVGKIINDGDIMNSYNSAKAVLNCFAAHYTSEGKSENTLKDTIVKSDKLLLDINHLYNQTILLGNDNIEVVKGYHNLLENYGTFKDEIKEDSLLTGTYSLDLAVKTILNTLQTKIITVENELIPKEKIV